MRYGNIIFQTERGLFVRNINFGGTRTGITFKMI